MTDGENNKNPFQYFWEMATGGLFSDGSDDELIPDKTAGKNRKKKKPKEKPEKKVDSKRSQIDSENRKKAG